MNIIAVDDERRSLRMLEKALDQIAPEAEIHGFTSAGEALAYAGEHRIDVAFLDIMMGGMDGLLLAKRLKSLYDRTNIIFVTGYSQYAGSAFDLHASGYLMKPVNPQRVREELENLRSPVVAQPMPRIRVQCFGSFGVFVDGRPLQFTRAKPRELLAYLVHKQGAAVTNGQIASILWEKKADTLSVQSNTRNVIAQLMQLLRDADAEDAIVKARNSTAINLPRISCDYYDYLLGKPEAINAYVGEYLSDYSWAEFTAAYLNNRNG
ncbi:response regulator [Eubacteriales bacterium OttesenSCG-928-A19]|nr:response regulator [Eubacteriales bacterium OttesenSCG-928-A19]